jgi:hypothetical protein
MFEIKFNAPTPIYGVTLQSTVHNLLPYIFFQLWRTQSHIFKLFDLGTSMATERYEPHNSELKTRIKPDIISHKTPQLFNQKL